VGLDTVVLQDFVVEKAEAFVETETPPISPV
jgi:hypothetical protein